MRSLQKGFSAIEVILLVVMLAIAGVVGWRIWDENQKSATTDSSYSQAEEVPDINNEADLDSASKTLENSDIGENYEKELDSASNY